MKVTSIAVHIGLCGLQVLLTILTQLEVGDVQYIRLQPQLNVTCTLYFHKVYYSFPMIMRFNGTFFYNILVKFNSCSLAYKNFHGFYVLQFEFFCPFKMRRFVQLVKEQLRSHFLSIYFINKKL